MEGKSTKGSADLEHEDRAIACFLVCCSHLAAIEDESMRNSIIDSLSAFASGCVDDNRQAMDEADKMASARGMSSRELLQANRNAGLGEPAPKEPTEH
jgi:hypothetical protein